MDFFFCWKLFKTCDYFEVALFAEIEKLTIKYDLIYILKTVTKNYKGQKFKLKSGDMLYFIAIDQKSGMAKVKTNEKKPQFLLVHLN